MATAAETPEPVHKTKSKLNKNRIKNADIKSEAGKLGPETTATIPEDIEIMYAGKMCELMNKNSVRAFNIHAGYIRAYKTITPEVKQRLDAQLEKFETQFDEEKKRTIALASNHPLWLRLQGIRGLTPYTLAIIMSHVGRIENFNTPSNLMVYSGLAAINGLPVTKANLAKIKEYYIAQNKFETVPAIKIAETNYISYQDIMGTVETIKANEAAASVDLTLRDSDGKKKKFTINIATSVTRLKEFKGFDTQFSGRMFVLTDNLLRAQGFFLDFFQKIRVRLNAQAINDGRTELKEGKRYMIGRKNFSLDAWTMANARRRVARTILHFIYTEWRTIKGLEARNPYPIDYLGHKSFITLEQVKAYDANVIVTRKRKAKPAAAADDGTGNNSAVAE